MTLGTALDLLLFQLAVRAEEQHGRAAAEAQVAANAGTVFALLRPARSGSGPCCRRSRRLVVPEAYRGPFATYSVALMPGLFCLAMMFYALNPIFQIRRRTLPVIAAAAGRARGQRCAASWSCPAWPAASASRWPRPSASPPPPSGSAGGR